MESLPSAPLDTQHILSWHLGAQPVTDRVFTSPFYGERIRAHSTAEPTLRKETHTLAPRMFHNFSAIALPPQI